MSLNSYKTKYMTTTTRQERQSISSQKIDYVVTHKVLGVTIHNNLSSKNRVNELTKRVSQKLYQLWKIKHFLNAHARKVFLFFIFYFFNAHIQSIVEHVSILWDSASAKTLKPLASINKRSLKLTLLNTHP